MALAGRRLAKAVLPWYQSLRPDCVKQHHRRFFSAANAQRHCHEGGTAAPTLLHASAQKVSAVPSRRMRKENAVTSEKLAKLRQLFGAHGIHAYIVPSEDAHQSEFLAECFNRRAYISDFTGSAGTAVITLDKAALWTDGRYFLQAEKQLGQEWTLMRAGCSGVPTYGEWLRDTLSPGSSVGIDPFLFTSESAEELKRTIAEKGMKVTYIPSNLVDKVWGDQRPAFPSAPVRVHSIKYAGVDVPAKIASVRKELSSTGATAIVIAMLDEVAWLFNIRGADIPHSPVAYAYAIVEMDKATLFIDIAKVSPEVETHLQKSNVSVKPYDALLDEIKRLAQTNSKLWLDSSNVNMAIVNTFSEACASIYSSKGRRVDDGPAVLFRTSPISLAKSVKNNAEMSGLKQAHLRDAAALTEFWAWIEEKVVIEKMKLTEVEVAAKLLDFRSKQEGFLDTSFDTICGSGPNGAIIHYRAQEDSAAVVDDSNLLLLDSGAQYVDGTTDITRTVHFGIPSDYQKDCFTRVLKGHIALDEVIFPEGTPGFVLDVLARTSLWKNGLDYRHGTGHGVGAALNVHEGPQSISFRFGNMYDLRAGMVVSNEPGYYEDHHFGIRIENLLYVREANTPHRFGGKSYLGFERLSFVPIQAKLVDTSLMSNEEISWLNSYHAEVWEKVSPLVQGRALQWLQRNTAPIQL